MKYILLPLLSLFYIIPSTAQDRVFAYTYQSNVLNKGDVDLEYIATLKTGKAGAYSPYVFGQELNQQIELEFGLGKKVQTAFYLNTELFHFADTASTDISQELSVNFSNEWKWKLADPVANRVGMGLYGEVEVGGSHVEFEGKLILDKKLPHDLLAFNVVGVYEIEKEIERENNITTAEWEKSSALELNFGYMHFFKPDLSIGIEVKNNNDISPENGWINSVWFAGPAFHASIGKCFILLTALPQLGNLHKTDEAPGSLDLNAYEKMEIRVLAGYNF